MCVCAIRGKTFIFFFKNLELKFARISGEDKSRALSFTMYECDCIEFFFFFKSNIPKKRFFSGLDVWTSGLLNFVLNMETFFFLFLGFVFYCQWAKTNHFNWIRKCDGDGDIFQVEQQ